MKRRAQPDQRADTRGGRWAGIPHVVIDSLAYRTLGLTARAILVEIVRRFNGYNNGAIGISQREIGAALGLTNHRHIGPSIAELVEHGLIEVTTEGQWKARQARCYRLTFVSTGGPAAHSPATNAYRGFSSDAKVASEPAVSDATLASARRKSDASVASTLELTPQKSVDRVLPP